MSGQFTLKGAKHLFYAGSNKPVTLPLPSAGE
jgi:hypothetical protein